MITKSYVSVICPLPSAGSLTRLGRALRAGCCRGGNRRVARSAPVAHHPAVGSDREGVTVSDEALPAVSCRNVWKIYGANADKIVGTPTADLPRADLLAQTGCVAAVRDVSFDVTAGEVFVVMGLSGSGKSTLVRMLNRIHDPTAGEVLLDGDDIMKLDEDRLREVRRTKISMVFQHFGLLPHRRIVDNVGFGLEIRGVEKVGARGQGERGARDRRPRRVGGVLSRRAVRRHATACRSCPRALHRPRDHAVRRAVLRAGPADPPRHAGRGDPSAARGAQDDDLHHPRPGRGAEARRPDRDHEGRQVRPGRHARRGGGQPGGRLRRRLHARRAPGARAHGAHDHAPRERRRRLRGRRRGLDDRAGPARDGRQRAPARTASWTTARRSASWIGPRCSKR